MFLMDDEDIVRYGGIPPEDATESPSIFYGGVEYTVGQHVLGGYMQRKIEQKYGLPHYGGAENKREMSHYILAGANGPVLTVLNNIIKKKEQVTALVDEKIPIWQAQNNNLSGLHVEAVYFSFPDFQISEELVKRAAVDPYGLVIITNMIVGFVNDFAAAPIGMPPIKEKITPLNYPREEPIGKESIGKEPIETERELLPAHIEFEREILPAAMTALKAAEDQLDKWL